MLSCNICRMKNCDTCGIAVEVDCLYPLEDRLKKEKNIVNGGYSSIEENNLNGFYFIKSWGQILCTPHTKLLDNGSIEYENCVSLFTTAMEKGMPSHRCLYIKDNKVNISGFSF